MRDPTRDSDGALFLIEPRDESGQMIYGREERGKAGARHAYPGTGELEQEVVLMTEASAARVATSGTWRGAGS